MKRFFILFLVAVMALAVNAQNPKLPDAQAALKQNI